MRKRRPIICNIGAKKSVEEVRKLERKLSTKGNHRRYIAVSRSAGSIPPSPGFNIFIEAGEGGVNSSNS